jgi:hypothetical protein
MPFGGLFGRDGRGFLNANEFRGSLISNIAGLIKMASIRKFSSRQEKNFRAPEIKNPGIWNFI